MTSGPHHTPPDLASAFRDHSRWIPAALFTTVGLILLGTFTARPVYHYFKIRRATQLATQAARLIDEGALTKAQGPLATAMAMAPELPEVIRQSARYSTRFLLPQSLQYWEMLESTGTATETDLREHIGVALDLQRTDAAGKALLRLRAISVREPESWLLLMRHDSQRDDLPTARTNARAALARFPSDPRINLAAGSLMLGQPEDPGEEFRGGSLLWSLAVSTNSLSAEAIRILTASPRISRNDKSVLATLLKRRVNPSPTERLLADEILWDTRPDSRPDLIRGEVEAARTATTVTDRVKVADWLSARGADTEVLSLLPAAASRTNLVVLERRLQALANLRRWEEIESELAAADSNTDPMLRSTFKALTAAQTQRSEQADAHFGNAIAASAGDPRRLFFIALAAERCGRNSAAVRAWSALLDSPTFAVKAGQAMLRLLANMDDLPSTARAFQKLLSFDSNNLELQRDLCITQALIGARLRENQEILLGLVEKNPGDTGLREALALVLLRLGNAQGALEQLERLPEPVEDTRLSRVIRVAVLGANQQRVRARALAAPLAKATLRNAERELVADWLPRAAQ